MSYGREFVGRKGWRVEGVRYRGSFDYAQDRLFALERRAEDDSKNKQRRRTGNGGLEGLGHEDGAAWRDAGLELLGGVEVLQGSLDVSEAAVDGDGALGASLSGMQS
jgi:hypothetical protein